MKDRAAVKMVEDVEARHGLAPGAKLVIATSGNMGVGMAMVCAVKQFQLYCLVDPKISPATERSMRLYGANVIKVFQRDETGGYHLTRLERVKTLLRENPDAIYLDQYDSPANMQAHHDSTGPEILEALEGRVDAVVMAAGTGGSSMGIARFFREHSPKTRIWLVDEEGSLALPSNPGPRDRFLNGMGTSVAPRNYDWPNFDRFVDEVVYVQAAESISASVELARTEGILAGGSGGAAVLVARRAASALRNEGGNVVALLPDHGSRYTDTQFDVEWLSARDIFVPSLYDSKDEGK